MQESPLVLLNESLMSLMEVCRYAFGAIAEWQCRLGVSQQGMSGSRPLKDMARLRLRRAHSKRLCCWQQCLCHSRGVVLI